MLRQIKRGILNATEVFVNSNRQICKVHLGTAEK